MDRRSEALDNVFVFAKILVALMVTVAIGVGAYVGWRWYNDHSETEGRDGVTRAQVIRATLFARNELRVGRLSGTVQGRGQTSRLWGWLPSSQVIKAPFSVDYFVDMGEIGPADVVMSKDEGRLLVTAPDVYADQPNVDMAGATLNNLRGWFVSRSATAELAAKAAGSAKTVATERARRPENLSKNREFARAALKRFLEKALRAAKVDARVEVRFAGEQPSSDTHWDMSRSVAEVLRDFPDMRDR
jgi:hypothetical protein